MIRKIAGVVSFLVGLLIIIGFPWSKNYQPEQMARTGVLVGIVLLGLGIYLMKT